MKKVVLLSALALGLLGCGYHSQVLKPSDLQSYQTLQESKVCVEDKGCFIVAVLRGKDGKDYLMIDDRVKETKRQWNSDLKLCDLTTLKEEIEKKGSGKCEAEDTNTWRPEGSLSIFHTYLTFGIYYNSGFIPLEKDYKIELRVHSAGEPRYKGYCFLDERCKFHPLWGTSSPAYGIEWDKGKLRVFAKSYKEYLKNVVILGDKNPFFEGELYGEWIDLTPYLPIDKIPKKR